MKNERRPNAINGKLSDSKRRGEDEEVRGESE
jgi:hypothetical protein